MAKLKTTEIRRLADATGISIGGSSSSPYPTMGQLKALIDNAIALKKPTAEAARKRAIRIARKHNLIQGAQPTLIVEVWAVDAIIEAILEA